MMSLERFQAGTTSRVIVTRTPKGWDFKEERDNTVIREKTYTDWHRVERAVQEFERREEPYSTNR
jgi:hypothetical protein